MKVLIVDDSRASRLMVKTCLKELECETVEADGGEAAVNLFKEGGIDLVLMDIHMPKIDGYEACRRIRALELAAKAPPIPIIALTAMDANQAGAKAKSAGATLCQTKPVKQTALLEAIRAIMPIGTLTTASEPPAVAVEPPKEASRWGLSRILNRSKPDAADGLAQPELRYVRPEFLIEKHEEVERAMRAVDAAHFETALLLAHRLKGEGANFGFKEISDLGAMLATAAQNKDFRTARAALEKLRAFLGKATKQAGLVAAGH